MSAAPSFYFGNLTSDQEEALGWVLDLAHDDQESYLHYGNQKVDYGDEWPEAAKQKAAYCRHIAEIAGINGECERWTALAEAFEATLEGEDHAT